METEDGWALLGAVGFCKKSDLIRGIDASEIDDPKGIREKPSPAAQPGRGRCSTKEEGRRSELPILALLRR